MDSKRTEKMIPRVVSIATPEQQIRNILTINSTLFRARRPPWIDCMVKTKDKSERRKSDREKMILPMVFTVI